MTPDESLTPADGPGAGPVLSEMFIGADLDGPAAEVATPVPQPSTPPER